MTVLLDELFEQAIATAGTKTGEAAASVLRVLALALAQIARRSEPVGGRGHGPPPWTKGQFAARHQRSVAWVDRLVRAGLPHTWAGGSKRFGDDADEWLATQGRIVHQGAPDVDVSAALASGGLRAIRGGK